MHFDLTDLRLFVAIAETNSLTKGAERVHMSVSAASIRVKHLEESVGTRLLHRNSQGVTLSAPGQALTHHARMVVSQLEHLRSELLEYGRGIKGQLRLLANTTASTEFLPVVLRRYLSSHPDVNVELRERPSCDIVRALCDGHADIGIVAGTVRTEGLETMTYRLDKLVLVVPTRHPIATEAVVGFSRSLDFNHVGLHEGSAIHAFLKERSQCLHRNFNLRIQVGNFEAACRMVEADVGLSVMPESVARRYRQVMEVRILQLDDEWALRQLQVCVRALEQLPAFARALVDLLKADAVAAGACVLKPTKREPSP